MPIDASRLAQLRRTIAGDVIAPDDPAYDDARRLWNARFDGHPAVIVRPRSPVEVATAIAFAREHDTELAVRSGGHSQSGHSTVDDGLVIDLSALRGVEVDPAARVARVRGGSLLGELDVAAQAHGLVCPVGVVGHTGVAGLTLGGGVGRLQRAFGLTIDNVLAVELVTADGRVVRASADEEPELFFGLRGAGWNFGVVTAFELRLHPFAGRLNRLVRTYAARDAQAAWELFRAYAATAPDSVSLIFGLDRAPVDPADAADPAGTRRPAEPIAYLGLNHCGAPDTVERDLAGLAGGPPPLSETLGDAAYLEVQAAHDLAFGFGHRSYLKGANGDGLGAEALTRLLELVAEAPGEGTFSATAMGGAIGRVPEGATAFAGRDAAFDLSADAAWEDPALDEANRDWVRQCMAVVEPHITFGRYANENADTGPDETRLLYGDAKLARLARLKHAWDPDNVFRRNHNVAPEADA